MHILGVANLARRSKALDNLSALLEKRVLPQAKCLFAEVLTTDIRKSKSGSSHVLLGLGILKRDTYMPLGRQNPIVGDSSPSSPWREVFG